MGGPPWPAGVVTKHAACHTQGTVLVFTGRRFLARCLIPRAGAATGGVVEPTAVRALCYRFHCGHGSGR